MFVKLARLFNQLWCRHTLWMFIGDDGPTARGLSSECHNRKCGLKRKATFDELYAVYEVDLRRIEDEEAVRRVIGSVDVQFAD
jgi:hypothetical protein